MLILDESDKISDKTDNSEGSFSLAEREERIDGVMGGRESVDEWLDTVGRRREGSRYDAEQRMSSEDKAVDWIQEFCWLSHCPEVSRVWDTGQPDNKHKLPLIIHIIYAWFVEILVILL